MRVNGCTLGARDVFMAFERAAKHAGPSARRKAIEHNSNLGKCVMRAAPSHPQYSWEMMSRSFDWLLGSSGLGAGRKNLRCCSLYKSCCSLYEQQAESAQEFSLPDTSRSVLELGCCRYCCTRSASLLTTCHRS
eukprot:8685525-Pyramimonas_sp.AAC.1